MKEEIILIGGGGHCRSCIDVIEAQDVYQIAGIVDKEEKDAVSGYEIIGTDQDLSGLADKYKLALITLGQIKDPVKRKELYDHCLELGFSFPVIVSPRALVSGRAKISAGTIVMHKALVNAGVQIGENCIINSKALVEHDAVIEANCHISTCAVVNGDCHLGSGSFLGSNAVLCHGLSLCSGTVVGAGAVVIENISEPGTYAGNPARRIA